MHGAVKVGNGHQGFNAILVALLKEIFIKLETRFVWLQFIPLWEDPRPGNGQAIGFKAHFPKEGNVFLVAMVHINAFFSRVKIALFKVEHLFLTRNNRMTIRPNRYYIHIGQATAIFIISSLTLVSSRRPTPKETIWKLKFVGHLSTSLDWIVLLYPSLTQKSYKILGKTEPILRQLSLSCNTKRPDDSDLLIVHILIFCFKNHCG